MGAYLAKPEVTKDISKGQNKEFQYAAAAMQGWRR